MHFHSRIMLITALAAGVALTPSAASATPASGVTGVIVSQQTVGGRDYILRQITIQPGGSTGWHHHDGTLYAVVEHGTLTHTESDCVTTDSYGEGAFFVEASGAGNVHIGRNLGSTPVVLDVVYVDPEGSPLSVSDPNPGCSF